MSTPKTNLYDRQSDPEVNKPYLNEFIQKISQLPPRDKMAQIGIEPSVLGMPKDPGNISFNKVKSFFIDDPFDTTETTRVPTQWLEFNNLQSPINLISSMPDQTLFFMFYTQPYDVIQNIAYEELQNRGWEINESDLRWSITNEGRSFEFDLHSWTIKEIESDASQ